MISVQWKSAMIGGILLPLTNLPPAALLQSRFDKGSTMTSCISGIFRQTPLASRNAAAIFAILRHIIGGYVASSAVANFQTLLSRLAPKGKCTCVRDTPGHSPSNDLMPGMFDTHRRLTGRWPP